MKEESVKTERSIWGPFLVGSLVGAGAALLLAPKSGRELRQDIKRLASTTRDTVVSGIEKSRELYEETSSAVKGAVEAGKMAYIQERDKHRQAV